MRFLKSKALIFIVLAIFVLYLSNDFSLIDIKETALVVALGIDKYEDGVEVSAQLAVPKMSEQAEGTSGTTVSAKGDTVARAIENIGTRTGWYPKLSFCNVVVLGKSITDGNVMESVDYFIRTIKLQDSAELCAAEGTAKEVLTASSPLDTLSSFSLTKILQKDAESSSTITITSMREFAMGYYSKSGFSKMPLIKTVQAEAKGDATSDKSASKVQSETGNSGESGEDKKQLFDATTTLLFNKGKSVCTLDRNQTLAFNLLTHSISEAAIEVKNTTLNGKKANLLIAFRQNFGSVKLRFEKSVPVLKLSLRVAAKIDDTNVTAPPDELVSSYVIPENILLDTENLLKSYLEDIFQKTRDAGCDLFETEDKLYRTAHKFYPAFKGRMLEQVKLDIKINVTSFK